MSYQGICSDNLESDAYCVRKIASEEIEMIVAHSYSKIMSLYGERVGSLTITSNDQSALENIESQMKIIIRSCYSNPPRHGGLIAEKILNDKRLKSMWISELNGMNKKLKLVRRLLFENLKKKNSRNWDFLIKHHGMFSYTGLNERQVILY